MAVAARKDMVATWSSDFASSPVVLASIIITAPKENKKRRKREI
jgi:hypothetical protein